MVVAISAHDLVFIAIASLPARAHRDTMVNTSFVFLLLGFIVLSAVPQVDSRRVYGYTRSEWVAWWESWTSGEWFAYLSHAFGWTAGEWGSWATEQGFLSNGVMDAGGLTSWWLQEEMWC